MRVLEAAARAGGVVATLERQGFRFEEGPSTVPASAPEFRRLVHDLGLDERLVASRAAAKERFLLAGGRLRPIPRGPLAFLGTSLLSFPGKLRLCSEPFRRHRPRASGALEPDLASFLSERIGPEAARVFAGAFVRGVYAAELGELGAQSAFPRLWALAEEHGGLARGALAQRSAPRSPPPGPAFPRGSLVSFERGLVELVDALAGVLGPRLVTGARVERLERRERGYRATTAAGERHDAERIVLAVPAPAAARLLRGIAPVGLPIDVLEAVPHASVALVHLGFRRDALPDLPEGFGYLVPPPPAQWRAAELKPPRVLGTIFASDLFPGRAPQGMTAVTSFYRSEDVESAAGARDDGALVELAARELAQAAGAPRPPQLATSAVRRWKDVLPRYAPGHARKIAALLERVRAELPGVELAGNYVAGVSVDHVIGRGRAVARGMAAGVYDRSAEARVTA